MNTMKNNGQHLIAELWECQCDNSLLCRSEPLLSQLREAVDSVGLTLVGQCFHEFSPQNVNDHESKEQTSGTTISLLLAESHLCLHTWGELATVTIDIYVCNFLNDNSQKAKDLFDICCAILRPRDYHLETVIRHHGRPEN